MENRKIAYGMLHCHSEESLKDSALPVKELVDKAVELGSPAVALTDHRTMTGIPEFMAYVKTLNDKAGKIVINGIPGVEADVDNKHLVLLAMDYEHGYKTIIRAVTESHNYLSQSGLPQMNKDILKKYFGQGGPGHGYVIALSGCVGGVLCKILNSNEMLEEDIKKTLKKMKDCNDPCDPSYLSNMKNLENLGAKVKELMEKRDALTKLSKKTFKKREKIVSILKEKDDALYQEELELLNKDKQECEDAKVELEKVKAELERTKKIESAVRKNVKETAETHEKFIAYSKRLEYLKSEKKTETELYEKTKAEAYWYQDTFGKNRFFIELQNHRIEEEIKFFPLLLKIAKETGIPYVATNDVHIKSSEYNDVRARQIQRFIRFAKYEALSDADYHLYPKTDEEMLAILSEIIPLEDAVKAMEMIGYIANMCHVEFPKEDHYPKFPVPESITADELIRKIAYERIPIYFKENEWTEEYAKRLEYELDVICKMGYSDYHLIVQDMLEVGRKLGKLSDENLEYLTEHRGEMNLEEFIRYIDEHQTELGYTIGPGRGSAAGSLVCYILGITNIDPIKYNLLFERFLNVERVSMPDIDSDISPDVRELVIEYLKKRYGAGSVCNIMTRGTHAAKASVRATARFLGAEKKNDSLYYYRLGDEISKTIPAEVGITLDKAQDKLDEYIDSVQNTELKNVASEIVELAKMIEGKKISIGMHAAGVIIADNGDVGEYISLLYNTDKKQWCCQCDMVEAESVGLLKMDALGLKNLMIITNTIRKIKRNYGITIDMDKIPFEPEVFTNIYATGKTNGVFQVESGGMKGMLTEFKPDCIEDIVLLVAAYRPGPMQYLDNIIAVKHGKKKAKYLTPELEPILASTYSSIIYQEQVQQIFQKLAGYSLGQADLVRRAMSKKKEKVLKAERQAFVYGDIERNIAGCKENGISEVIANQLFDEMMDFAKYAFNRSHAAAYAMVSYQTAWLKYHYPAEFLCAVMNTKEIKEYPLYFDECKMYGIKIKGCTINQSLEHFVEVQEPDGSMSILFGIGNVKGVKSASTQIVKSRNTGYVSFKDYMLNGHIRKDVTEALIYAGAFDNFSNNRAMLVHTMEAYQKVIKKIKDKSKDIELQEKSLTMEKLSEKEKKKLTDSLVRAKKSLAQLNEQLQDIKPIPVDEDYTTRLEKEYEVLGAYVTGHPLDIYTSDLPVTKFSEMIPGKEYYALVLISNYRVVERKKDGKPLAFMTASDKVMEIDAQCFTKAFSKIGERLEDGKAVVVKGKYNEQIENRGTEEEDIIRSFAISDVFDATIRRKTVMMSMPILEWPEMRKILKTMETSGNEYDVVLYDTLCGDMRKTDVTVNIATLERFQIPYEIEIDE